MQFFPNTVAFDISTPNLSESGYSSAHVIEQRCIVGVHHTSTKLGTKQNTMAHRPVEDGVCGEIFGVQKQIVRYAGPFYKNFVQVGATCKNDS